MVFVELSTEGGSPQPREEDAEDPPIRLELVYVAFAVVWACALTFDKVSRGFTHNEFTLTVPFVAIFVLASPRSTPRLAALALVHIVEIVYKFEAKLTIHWLLMALGNAVVLSAYLNLAFRGRTLDVTPAQLWRNAAPALRGLGLVAMFAAGFAKLNSAFLDPRQSCAVALYEFQRQLPPYSWVLPDTAPWVRWSAIALPVTAEALGPFLLVWQRTRWLGILLCSLFLTLIGTNAQANLFVFATPVLALLVLPFVSLRDWQDMRALWLDNEAARRLLAMKETKLGEVVSTLATVIVLFFLVWMVTPIGESPEGKEFRNLVIRIVFGFTMAGFMLSFALCKIRSRARFTEVTPPIPSWPRPRWLLVFPLFLALNDASVYLGFSHHPSFTMAGNLVLTPEVSNHYLVRRTPRLDATRLVVIVASSDKRLKKLRGGRNGVPWYALRDYLARNPDISVTFELEGKRETIPRAGDDPRFQRSSTIAAWLNRGSERRWASVTGNRRAEAGTKKGCHHNVEAKQRKLEKRKRELRKKRRKHPLRKPV